MSLSRLPLSYCTNVHPAQTLAEVQLGIDQFSLPIQAAGGSRIAVGLWLARSVIDQLQTADQRHALADFLNQRELTCYTLNAFPYGNFHNDRVKEQVYLPDWTTDARRQYTLDCAQVLSSLLPPDVDGSISTVPLGFKPLSTSSDFEERCIAQLLKLADEFHDLRERTGRMVRLAIEPEPLCVLETTPETLAFFEHLRAAVVSQEQLTRVRDHLGVCYDVCHQAVEFEEVSASIADLAAAEIRINKVHLSCAIRARNVVGSPEVREALARYIEPRYLHQTCVKTAGGDVARWTDLDDFLLREPPAEFAAADEWRVHFHVPIDAESLGPLQTTRESLGAALRAVEQLAYAPHLEVETYTWEVMPDGGKPRVIDGFAREMRAARALLSRISSDKAQQCQS